MDGRGGCCIDRYAAHDMSKVDRIMLKYRPIAPKPAAAGAVPAGSVPENNNVKTGRGKRRYVNDGNKNNSNNNRGRKASPSKSNSGGCSSSGGEKVVALPLLPETPEGKDYWARVSGKAPIWLSFDRREGVGAGKTKEWVETWLTVECVTETRAEGRALGDRDEERMMNLERDTCPGFVSDGFERVVWTNKAYGEMVGEEEKIMVGLAMNGSVLLPVMSEEAFACQVRVTCGKERGWSKTVPCDVWRMDSGAYAWRLDIKVALSLGRY